MKACIAAISGKTQETDLNESNKFQDDIFSGDTGNSFGGRAYNRTKTLFKSPLSLALIYLMIFIQF